MCLFAHLYFWLFTIWWLFTILALCWCLSFVVIMLGIETSQVGDFADMARSTIDFTISPASLSDGMSFAPTWKLMWSGLSRIIGWSTKHLTFAPWDGFTEMALRNAITYNKYPFTIFPFLIDLISLHVFAIVISLDDKLFLSILLRSSCRWFFWDMSHCWTSSFVLFFV